MNERKRTIMLGVVFLLCLALAYIENVSFFNYLRDAFSSPTVAFLLVFIHNVLAVSLILVGMTFYVGFVLTFLPKRKFEYVVLEHPRIFAFAYTVMILLISILRTSMLVYGQVFLETLPLIILLSAPNGIIEGYGIFQTIEKTLERIMTMKDLAIIYMLFLVAAVIEVGYIQLLSWI
ncbi:MAG: hypothetical protein AOA66_0388 [Candidatus Bathyarchaeota archaeon BA2]|nr:MAG: hypothetical protein AOA66_0388 [Candidatus Bathyarchaeota archaeon BA2]